MKKSTGLRKIKNQGIREHNIPMTRHAWDISVNSLADIAETMMSSVQINCKF